MQAVKVVVIPDNTRLNYGFSSKTAKYLRHNSFSGFVAIRRVLNFVFFPGYGYFFFLLPFLVFGMPEVSLTL